MSQEQHSSPVVNFGPIGLLGFGMTTVLLNIHNAGFFPICSVILAMGVFYGGLAQVIAGILGAVRPGGNTFSATAFISYGFFWLSLVSIWVLPKLGLTAETCEAFMGWYLFLWGVFTLFMFIATFRAVVALRVVFGSLTLLFFLLAIRDWSGSELIGQAAGWVGIFCGSSAIYLAAAEVLNEQFDRTILPM